jgi:hypothetical protein
MPHDQAVSSFEKSHPGDTITIDYIEHQSDKQKIQLAMGAGNPPTIIWTWGGGPLKQFINAGDVASLGNPGWASGFLPSSLGAVTFDGKLYGVPIEGTQPVCFFYNKTIFSKLGLSFLTTFSGLISTVSTLKSHGYAPISLANGGLVRRDAKAGHAQPGLRCHALRPVPGTNSSCRTVRVLARRSVRPASPCGTVWQGVLCDGAERGSRSAAAPGGREPRRPRGTGRLPRRGPRGGRGRTRLAGPVRP